MVRYQWLVVLPQIEKIPMTYLDPVEVQSLKEACTVRLEELVLSGEVKIGDRLPPERELAERLGVSRPIVHEALVDLAAKGLISIIPRRGVYVNDFRMCGSIAMISSLLGYTGSSLGPDIRNGLVDTRLLIERETARLAAFNRSDENLLVFEKILAQEKAAALGDWEALTAIDFNFHLHTAFTSENFIYPLIINSFKSVYTAMTRHFFKENAGSLVIGEVFVFHRRLVAAISARQEEDAAAIMADLLLHGARHTNF